MWCGAGRLREASNSAWPCVLFSGPNFVAVSRIGQGWRTMLYTQCIHEPAQAVIQANSLGQSGPLEVYTNANTRPSSSDWSTAHVTKAPVISQFAQRKITPCVQHHCVSIAGDEELVVWFGIGA